MRDEQGNLILPPTMDEIEARRSNLKKVGEEPKPAEKKVKEVKRSNVKISIKGLKLLNLTKYNMQMKTQDSTIRLLIRYYERRKRDSPLTSEDFY